MKKKVKKKTGAKKPKPDRPVARRRPDPSAELDEALRESFPASDPPSIVRPGR